MIFFCSLFFLLLFVSFFRSVCAMIKKGANAKAEITSIETIENGTCASNIRCCILRFVGFLVSFPKLFVSFAYFFSPSLSLSLSSLRVCLSYQTHTKCVCVCSMCSENMLPRIIRYVTHSINNISTTLLWTKLMGWQWWWFECSNSSACGFCD